jgi:serine/threonine protein kinase
MSGFTERLIGLQLGGYVVRNYIARGGMGVVYEGYQASLDRSVAIKVLYPHLSDDPTFIERFQREARAVAQLRHPHIVGVIDSGADQGYYFMVMELIRGNSLRGELAAIRQRGERMSPTRAFEIVQQVGSALSYAHRRGIVHRDIKPGNILMDEEGRVSLSDFGLVKLVEGGHLTATGAIIGTPEYMAPEQFTASDQVGPAADQYALAVVTYELLIGRVPFSATTPVGIIQKHISEPPPAPRALDPAVPDAVEAVLLRGLAKAPEQRYPSVDEFVRALLQSAADAIGPFSVTLLPLAPESMTAGQTSLPFAPTEPYRPAPETAAGAAMVGDTPDADLPAAAGTPLVGEPPPASRPSAPLATPEYAPQSANPTASASAASAAGLRQPVSPVSPTSGPDAATPAISSPMTSVPTPQPSSASMSQPAATAASVPPGAVPVPVTGAGSRRGGRLLFALAGGALVVVLAVGGAIFALSGDDDSPSPTATSLQAVASPSAAGEEANLLATVTFVMGEGETPTNESGGGPTPTGESAAAPTATSEASTATPTVTPRPSTTTVVIRPIAPTPTRPTVQMPIPTPDPNAPTAEADDSLNVDGSLTTVLSQDFASGEAGAFAIGSLSYGSAELANGQYVLSVPDAGWQTSVPDPALDLAEGGVAAVTTLSGDGSVGLIARSRFLDNGTYQFYLCWINGHGGGGCHLWNNETWNELFTVADGTIQLLGTETLTMIVSGNQIGFQVNDQFVGQAQDDTIPSGNWGMYVGSYSGAVSAPFSSILIAEIT